jgi:hypothetical protein
MLHYDDNKLVIDFIHKKSFIVLPWLWLIGLLAGTKKQMKFSQLNILGIPTSFSNRHSNFGKPHDE